MRSPAKPAVAEMQKTKAQDNFRGSFLKICNNNLYRSSHRGCTAFQSYIMKMHLNGIGTAILVLHTRDVKLKILLTQAIDMMQGFVQMEL